jgi:Ca2+/Na+ antiporter
MLGLVLLEVGNNVQNIGLNDVVSVAVVIFALVLSGISLLAYKKTRLPRLILISIAFALFGVNVLLDHLDLLFPNLNITNSFALMNSLMSLLILMLFFLALVKKWDTAKRREGRYRKQ